VYDGFIDDLALQQGFAAIEKQPRGRALANGEVHRAAGGVGGHAQLAEGDEAIAARQIAPIGQVQRQVHGSTPRTRR